MDCHNPKNTVCADVKERNCSIVQNLVEETDFVNECHYETSKVCHPYYGTKIDCYPVEDEICVEKQVLECDKKQRTVEDIVHKKSCRDESTTIRLKKFEEVCLPFEEEKCAKSQKADCDVEFNEETEEFESLDGTQKTHSVELPWVAMPTFFSGKLRQAVFN